MAEFVKFELGLLLRWWRMRAWFRRCPECHRRGYSTAAPRWAEDPVAQMLGIAQDGCPGCGKVVPSGDGA